MTAQILVADDEPRYVRLMEANLVSEGYQVLKEVAGVTKKEYARLQVIAALGKRLSQNEAIGKPIRNAEDAANALMWLGAEEVEKTVVILFKHETSGSQDS